MILKKYYKEDLSWLPIGRSKKYETKSDAGKNPEIVIKELEDK
jgi:hypothetical protein